MYLALSTSTQCNGANGLNVETLFENITASASGFRVISTCARVIIIILMALILCYGTNHKMLLELNVHA